MISINKIMLGFGEQPSWLVYVGDEEYKHFTENYSHAIICVSQITLSSPKDFLNLMSQIKQDSLIKNISPATYLNDDIRVRWSGIMDILSKTGASVSCTRQMMKFLEEEITSATLISSKHKRLNTDNQHMQWVMQDMRDYDY